MMKLLFSILLTASISSVYAQKISRDRLIVDLNADKGVVVADGDKVEQWKNQVKSFVVKDFSKRDEGRKVPGSGRPKLTTKVAELNGHNTLVFNKQELVNMDEDAFDHLTMGGGYTWFAVLKAGKQSGELPNVNCFFGNLRNKPNNEGFWGGFNDDNSFWMSSRNAITFGRWDQNNPYVTSKEIVKQDQYYLIMGRMGKGTDTVTLSLYLNEGAKAIATSPFPVSKNVNPSRMAIGQERDAVEHPGRESFVGEMARFMLYDRPLTDQEMELSAKQIVEYYGIKPYVASAVPSTVFGIKVNNENKLPLYIIKDGEKTIKLVGMSIEPKERNFLSVLPQGTITSIEVLKDADATTIYGIEGKNGIVIINVLQNELENVRKILKVEGFID
ncbi:LamG-like jellyroll fold domain-containing protein [Pedobacter sp. PWIIR3]